MPILKNAKHELFAKSVVKGKTLDESYVIAGYRPHPANPKRLRENEAVSGRINELLERSETLTNISVERIAQELARIGFSKVTDVVSFTNKTVRLKNSAELDDDVTAAIAEIQQTKDGVKLKFHDKRGALTELAKYKGMFKENINLNVTVSLADLVNSSYQPDLPALPAPKTIEHEE
jgi:phage terminase small subunit